MNLVSQVTACLREALAHREWSGTLPSEHHLCDRLQVSRCTLRAGLQILEREGWITSGQGKARKILRDFPRHPRRSLPQRIGILSGVPLSQLGSSTLRLYAEIREHLQKGGWECEFYANTSFRSGSFSGLPKTLQEDNACRAWMLLSCGAATQRWFCKNGMPALLMGHRHSGVDLPFVDVDYFGVSQHAARLLLAKGHRRFAVILPNREAPGDLLALKGFENAVCKSGNPHIAIFRMATSLHRASMERLAERLLNMTSRPTALYLAGADIAIALCPLILSMGKRIPEDFSIICRDGNATLDSFTPDLTRYVMKTGKESRKLASLAVQLGASGAIRASAHFLLPQFHPGSTVERISA